MQENQNNGGPGSNLGLKTHHLWIVALAATVGLIAIVVFGPKSDGPGRRTVHPEPVSQELTPAQAELQNLATGEITAFRARPSRGPISTVRFKDGTATPRTLEDFRGRVILLNVWATWCAPCRHEMPSLDALQAALGSDDFEVVALALDTRGAQAAQQMLDDLKIKNLKLYIDDTAKASRSLAITGMPTTILIGRDGRELGRLEGPAEWNSTAARSLVTHAINAGAATP